MSTRTSRRSGAFGFTITDTVITMAVVATVAAIATPATKKTVGKYRLGMSVRDVERELQFAHTKAVSANRPMRVRLNCPDIGQVRVVELIGTPAAPDTADAAANRCDESVYPYRPTGAGSSRLTRPNNDGPIRRLQPDVTVTGQTLEFWPDGSVHADNSSGNPWPSVGVTGATLTLTRKTRSKNITVNGLGKIQLDR